MEKKRQICLTWSAFSFAFSFHHVLLQTFEKMAAACMVGMRPHYATAECRSVEAIRSALHTAEGLWPQKPDGWIKDPQLDLVQKESVKGSRRCGNSRWERRSHDHRFRAAPVAAF
jgi:hypothetical protein